MSDYCNPCSNAFRVAEISTSKRLEHSRRQQVARSNSYSSNRNIEHSPPSADSRASNADQIDNSSPSDLLTDSQDGPGFQSQPNLPDLNVTSLLQTYKEVKENNTHDKIFQDMYGLLIQMASKQKEVDCMKETIESNTKRLEMLENKVGGADVISDRLGLAVRYMPLPGHGVSELDAIRNAFREIKAPNVNVNQDIIKAIRKRPANKEDSLGTVMVEVRNEEVRTAIMRNKDVLNDHINPSLKNLVIKNTKSQDRMFAENCT